MRPAPDRIGRAGPLLLPGSISMIPPLLGRYCRRPRAAGGGESRREPLMSTFAKGLEGVVAAETRMSFIDGEKGVLEYVGIPIDALARNSTFEETVFLLWNTRLPKKGELAEFSTHLRSRYPLPKGFRDRILSFPKDAQPMHMLRTAVSTLAMYDPNPNANDVPSARDKSLNILAQTPTIVAWFDRHRRGLPLIEPKNDLSFAQTFLYMLNGEMP